MKFDDLEYGSKFIHKKKWYKKVTEKDSGDGIATDEKGRFNFFGNNQKVEQYERI